MAVEHWRLKFWNAGSFCQFFPFLSFLLFIICVSVESSDWRVEHLNTLLQQIDGHDHLNLPLLPTALTSQHRPSVPRSEGFQRVCDGSNYLYDGLSYSPSTTRASVTWPAIIWNSWPASWAELNWALHFHGLWPMGRLSYEKESKRDASWVELQNTRRTSYHVSDT